MGNYHFENLILLIGTNPLPNYATADFLLQQNTNIQKIWLLYSKENDLQGGTLPYAENVEKLLSKKRKESRPNLEFPLEKIGLSDVSRAVTIRNEIEKSRLNEKRQSAAFHLNYTGGTKTMSTHVYITLHNLFRKNISFSYLDARNFRLVSDDDNQIIAKDLRKNVSLPFEDMIELHGYQIYEKKENKVTVEKANELFAEFVNSHTSQERNEKIKNMHGGEWLEVYIANKLESIVKESSEYTEINKNILMKDPKWAGKRSNFEMDILVVNGYQLNGISCTITDKLEKCKQKGFEVILRTRQIGGDETRAVLITGSDKNQTELLQQQLILATGGNKKNIKVFGVEDLRREQYLLKELRRFMFSE